MSDQKGDLAYNHDENNVTILTTVIPERNLLAAMIGRAICDAFGSANVTAGDRRKARHWLFCEIEYDKPYSFGWTAAHLDLNPLIIQKCLREDQETNPQTFALRIMRLKTT